VSVVILGGGVCGVAAAYCLREREIEATVYEASPRAGGLLDNFSVAGFLFDQAAHVSFASETEVRKVFDQTPYDTHPATAWCWDDGVWLRHPVQNNLYPLSPQERVALIEGFLNRPDIQIKNYKDWLIYQYGEPIASRYPLVYTEKYWTIPAEQLGINWIGNRMRRAQVNEVLLGAMTSETPNTYYLGEVRYPKRGGYRAFIEPMIDKVAPATGYRAREIHPDARVVVFDNNERRRYTHLISTIPLPRLIDITDDVPATVRSDAATLFATEVDLISVGFSRPDVAQHLWFYVYDRDILASRVHSPSLMSAANAPKGGSSLQFEIYSSCRRPMALGPEELKQNVSLALDRFGLAKPADVLFMHHRRIPYGNVVFDLGMEERRDRVQAWVRDAGIVTAGRFGEWDYLWSNQSFMSGKRAAEQVAAA
jgi:protoporphyrinogen oxidase